MGLLARVTGKLHGRLRRRLGRGDEGSAIVEFSLVAVLLVFLLFAVLFYVRSIVAASAADGARYAANANVPTSQGASRATELIRRGLNDTVAHDVPCESSTRVDPESGLQLSTVRCFGSIHSVLLPLAALVRIDVQSRSLEEGP
jgi:Flp pilus assembly protein TadG